jgi:hypothetical protein
LNSFLSLSLSLSLSRDQTKPDIHTTAREEDFFLTVNNKQDQAPTNQPINQSHRLFLSSSWPNPSTPSINHQIQVSPASFTNHHPRCHGKLLLKISIRKEQKKQTQRITATKSQPPSF